MAADGFSNQEIADFLDLSRETVRQRLTHIYEVLGIEGEFGAPGTRKRDQLAEKLAELK